MNVLQVQIDWINDTTLTEVALLGMAFVLSATIGLERHRKIKSAGLRTHTLVGVGSALFTLVSAYGFSTIDGANVTLDPSRIAAQIVSGVGFLGAGLIFVRQNIVSGLTTAASIWVVAAIGMACGAGMPILAAFGAALHLVTTTLLAAVARRFPGATAGRDLSVVYVDGRGALRDILQRSTDMGFEVALHGTARRAADEELDTVEVALRFQRGRVPMAGLIEALTEIPNVRRVTTGGHGRRMR